MNKILTLLFLVSCLIGNRSIAQTAPSNTYTISGYVKEQGSGELLPGVTIYDADLQQGTSTNTYGFFSLTLPEGKRRIVVSFIGYQKQVKELSLTGDIQWEVQLEEDAVQLEEVQVVATQQEKVSERTEMSVVGVPVAQIQEIPAFLGEKDVMKVLQLMPGVQSGREGSSGIYVRGGGSDQNLLILDDAVVYNADHLFGFFSVFNGDALKSVELYKGGFPARFGGRLSSVLKMDMKDGNKEEFQGKAAIGLISSSLMVEGPLSEGKSSFLISGRRTYIDVLARPLMPADDKGGYYFYDLNAKVNYDFGPKNKLYLSGYFGRDVFYTRYNGDGNKSQGGVNWGNATGTLRWNHLFNNQLFANTTLVFSDYKFGIDSEEEEQDYTYELQYFSRIRDLSLKYDVDYLPNPRHHIRIGAQLTRHSFAPSALVLRDTYSDIDVNNQVFTNTFEGGLYIEDTYKPFPLLTINTGLRLSAFKHKNTQYFKPEPRVNISYRVADDLALKGSYAMMNQYIHRLSNTGIGLPTDLWVTSTENVAPQTSQQVALGLAKDFNESNLALTVEGYYKRSDNVIQYKEGATFLFIDDPESAYEGVDWENNITRGKGTSYGMEFMLQRKVGKLSGWVGYTLSWAKMHFPELNNGKEFFANQDRRHDLSIVSVYKPTKKVTLSATWVYGTGAPVNMAISTYVADQHNPSPDNASPQSPTYGYYAEVNYFGEKNNFRMAPYHRLDFAARFHKEKKRGTRTWEIGIYNLYNRRNPFFYFTDDTYNSDGTRTRKLKQVSLFPILPSISYRFDF
ncbi:TonB-dependent receptor [Limibacter armeniacum]|uniref:TonB-dependent receptor n=1 Tax=Limibacter armeniacum TaxID=466084 RepID=UPI002FE5CF1B